MQPEYVPPHLDPIPSNIVDNSFWKQNPRRGHGLAEAQPKKRIVVPSSELPTMRDTHRPDQTPKGYKREAGEDADLYRNSKRHKRSKRYKTPSSSEDDEDEEAAISRSYLQNESATIRDQPGVVAGGAAVIRSPGRARRHVRLRGISRSGMSFSFRLTCEVHYSITASFASATDASSRISKTYVSRALPLSTRADTGHPCKQARTSIVPVLTIISAAIDSESPFSDARRSSSLARLYFAFFSCRPSGQANSLSSSRATPSNCLACLPQDVAACACSSLLPSGKPGFHKQDGSSSPKLPT